MKALSTVLDGPRPLTAMVRTMDTPGACAEARDALPLSFFLSPLEEVSLLLRVLNSLPIILRSREVLLRLARALARKSTAMTLASPSRSTCRSRPKRGSECTGTGATATRPTTWASRMPSTNTETTGSYTVVASLRTADGQMLLATDTVQVTPRVGAWVGEATLSMVLVAGEFRIHTTGLRLDPGPEIPG